MTKRDLFRAIIKLFGLLILMNSIVLFLGQFGFFFSLSTEWEAILALLMAITLTCGLICLLVFFPDAIINLFKLDKGFDDEEVNLDDMKARSLIEFGVFIIGGFFILNSFAPLLVAIGYKVYAMADGSQLFSPPGSLDNTSLYIKIIELCAGSLTVFNYRSIARFILSKNKANEAG